MSAAGQLAVVDRRRLPFFMVTKPATVCMERELERGRLVYCRSIYFALVELANDNRGEVFSRPCSVVAQRAGVTNSTLRKYLPDLERLGLVQVVRQEVNGTPSAPHQFTLLDPPVPEPPHGSGGSRHTATPPPPHGSHAGASKTASLLQQEHEEGPPTPSSQDGTDAVRQVFEEWRRLFGRSVQAKLDSKRRDRIQWALKEYGLKQVLRCLRGYAGNPWRHEAPSHNELSTLLRNAGQVENGLEAPDVAPAKADDGMGESWAGFSTDYSGERVVTHQNGHR